MRRHLGAGEAVRECQTLVADAVLIGSAATVVVGFLGEFWTLVRDADFCLVGMRESGKGPSRR